MISRKDRNSKPMTNQKARALVQQEYYMTRQEKKGGAMSSQNILRQKLRESRNEPVYLNLDAQRSTSFDAGNR